MLSQSDGEVLPGEPVESSSTKVQSTPKDAADLNLLSHLVQIVSDQQQLLQDMRREQESNYAALQEKLLDLKVSIAKEQRAALAELKIDQRILMIFLNSPGICMGYISGRLGGNASYSHACYFFLMLIYIRIM